MQADRQRREHKRAQEITPERVQRMEADRKRYQQKLAQEITPERINAQADDIVNRPIERASWKHRKRYQSPRNNSGKSKRMEADRERHQQRAQETEREAILQRASRRVAQLLVRELVGFKVKMKPKIDGENSALISLKNVAISDNNICITVDGLIQKTLRFTNKSGHRRNSQPFTATRKTSATYTARCAKKHGRLPIKVWLSRTIPAGASATNRLRAAYFRLRTTWILEQCQHHYKPH